MKRNSIYSMLLALLVLTLSGCSEDKGNYDYTPIDEISVEGIQNSYSALVGGKLEISVNLIHSIENAGDEHLAYSWNVNGEEVSTEKDLDVFLPPLPLGKKINCTYTVTDTKTNMKFFSFFELNVVSSFNWGYYFLTEQADKKTILSYMPAFMDGKTYEDAEFLHTTACGDYSLGNNPKQITGTWGYISSLGNHYFTIALLSEGEMNKAIVTNNATFIPTTVLNESSFVDQTASHTFVPTEMTFDKRGLSYYVSDGKVIKFLNSLLYRPAKHDKDYHWSHVMFANSGGYFLWVYDDLSHKYYVIESTVSQPELGIIGDSDAYDSVLEITDSPSLEGESIIGRAEIYAGTDLLYVWTVKNGDLKLHTYSKPYNGTPEYVDSQSFSVPNADENSGVALVKNNDWYIAAGNKIYTASRIAPVMKDLVPLPSDCGKVVNIAASAKGSLLIVAMYDENSPAELKGSVVLVDLDSKTIVGTYRNVIEKCVSILAANTATSAFFSQGDDK